jgi:diacylglycerol kinase family enzyme
MRQQCWLAQLSILLMAGALTVLIVFAGWHSFGVIGFTLLGICVSIAGAYWFLARRGILRWAALALAVLAPIGVAVLFARYNHLWVALAVIAILLAAAAAARAAMGPVKRSPHSGEHRAHRPGRAFLIMNPRSGGGKVARFGLVAKARELGATVALLEGPDYIDVAQLAKRAVADGADLLGVAGGDGTQALVAGIAAEAGLPFLCISAGTRNHFAMDLGLDRDDPAACLEALTEGIERRIDLGRIGDRIFVNNASFGVYAELVRSPAYRDDKRGTTLQMLPELLSGNGTHKLRCVIGGTTPRNPPQGWVNTAVIEGPQAILVSNNPYDTRDIAGLGRRERLDTGRLGVIAVKVDNAAQAVSLMRADRGAGLTVLQSREITIDAPTDEIPVGIDGETILMPTPVRCSIEPKALRVVLPKHRPGRPATQAAFRWPKLIRLATGVRGGRPSGPVESGVLGGRTPQGDLLLGPRPTMG